MRILMIGGTVFVGREITRQALERGHEVTHFNRGQHNPDLFPEVEKLRGDRDGDLSALDGREWDAVIDTCGYVPRVVRKSAEKLASSGRYLFISSISVLSDMLSKGQTEDTALATVEDQATEEITGETYGGLKVLCEQEVQRSFGERAVIVRPGLIVGPNDSTDRFTYWPVRFARGGQVLAPDRKDQPVQFIDVRDLAGFCLNLIESGGSGAYFATGPLEPYPLSYVLEEVRREVNPPAETLWLPASFLEENEVEPWSDLPLVLPYDASMDGMSSVDVSKAVAAGLHFRPLAHTVRDTLEWALTRGDYELKSGLTPEREAALLEKWRSTTAMP